MGMFIDYDLVMQTHVQQTVLEGFPALHKLCQIRNSVPTATFQSLVVALLMSRLDYQNGVLIGLPIHVICLLQSVQNAAVSYLALITFQMHWSACTGCASWCVSSSGHSRFCMGLYRSISDLLFISLICRVDILSAQLALTACRCKLSKIGSWLFQVSGLHVYIGIVVADFSSKTENSPF